LTVIQLRIASILQLRSVGLVIDAKEPGRLGLVASGLLKRANNRIALDRTDMILGLTPKGSRAD
jgi:hypothetical protein